MDERNYFQLERDQVHTLGQITAKKLEEVLAEEKNLEKGLEEDEEHHQVEIKVSLVCKMMVEIELLGIFFTSIKCYNEIQNIHSDCRHMSMEYC